MTHKRIQFSVTPHNAIEVQFDFEFDDQLKANVSNIQLHSNYKYEFPPNPTIVIKDGKRVLESHYRNDKNENIVQWHDDPISKRIADEIQELVNRETPGFIG